MRIPLTRYGLPQVAVYPALALALQAALCVFLSGVLLIVLLIALAAFLVWALAFFRDPEREIPADDLALLSPADGTITDIGEAEVPELGGRALRIGMFLSIFNVHLNRMPCAARVESVAYKKGRFKNAMSADSGRVNESNSVFLTRLCEPREKIMLRQISGAIARRIVCEAAPGGEHAQGERFGMIKFGSRAEVYLPYSDAGFKVEVKIGDKVRAGLTRLGSYGGR
ncbi:MAG: phosphatidylserine decarboxylase [Treponema sp.]|nr:phosphatidylserine decarboxylase [Treponema sp.]